MDNATKSLAKMNLILHDCPTGEIWQDNTLSAPHFKEAKTGALKTFDFVVANPPFSTKAWTNGFDPANDQYNRFAFGLPPQKNGDYCVPPARARQPQEHLGRVGRDSRAPRSFNWLSCLS